jgi:hypothetical protein
MRGVYAMGKILVRGQTSEKKGFTGRASAWGIAAWLVTKLVQCKSVDANW